MAWENIKLAFKSMFTNKLRTLLSLLGIVIGVMSVVTILTLGNSASGSITDAIATGGTDLITIYTNGSSSTFTEEFSDTIAITPDVNPVTKSSKYDNKTLHNINAENDIPLNIPNPCQKALPRR